MCKIFDFMRLLFLILILVSSLSCRKFVWDNPSDSINSKTEPASLKDRLVPYYSFSGNANDESGNGNNGTVLGVTLVEDSTLTQIEITNLANN